MEMKRGLRSPKTTEGYGHGNHGSQSQSHLLSSTTTTTTSANEIVGSPTPRTPQRTWQHLTLDTWFGETFLMSFSFFSFLAIIVVLAVYDQKPSPNLKWGLKLNTIVSILAIASKSSLIFVVGEAIGQLKWIWFRTGKRRLKSLQTFDEASRGPLGSISVLFSRPKRGHGLITLGAAITIFALGFEAFMQQIVSYPMRQVARNSSQVSTKQNDILFDDYDYTYYDQAFIGAVYAGTWMDGFNMNPNCPSGNCTWPSFQSLAWCSQCEDVTSQASLANCSDIPDVTDITGTREYSCNVTLPHGSWSAFPIRAEDSDVMNTTLMEVPWQMVWNAGVNVHAVIAGVEKPMFTIAYAKLRMPPEETSHPEKDMKIKNVTQCVLSPCTRTYSVSVSNGEPSTRLSPPDWGNIVETCNDEYGCYLTEYNSTMNNALTPIATWADAALSSLEGIMYFTTVYNLTGPFWTQTGLIREDIIERLAVVGLEPVMDNIAASLTKYCLEHSNKTIHGTMSVSEVFISVDWEWIVLPVIVLLSTMTLLISTVLNNKKHGLYLWKSAILPTMYHGLENDLVADGPEYATVSQMQQTAKVPVELEFSDSRNRMMFRRS